MPVAPEPLGVEQTGTRLGAALLAYMLGVTLIITLLPFQFSWPSRWRVLFTGGAIDILANVLLFVPLGFLFRLATRERHRHSALVVMALGALASMGIESAQLFESERYSSALDVATNALGAMVGALTFDRLAPINRVNGALVGRLSLELPLMGLLYLLLPLLWLDSLASGAATAPERAGLALLLGLFGGSLVGGIQRYHLAPARGVPVRTTALAAGLWFLAGTFPGLPFRPAILLSGAVLVSVLSWWVGTRPVETGPGNRRYEGPLLRMAAPAYGAYLALLTVAPVLGGDTGRWEMGWGFPGGPEEWTKGEILRFLELAGAFTLLGYMVAEFRGRAVHQFGRALPRLVAWGAAAAILGEVVRGFHDGHGASVVRGALVSMAGIYGGWLYYLQLAHVRQLVSLSTGGERQSPITPGAEPADAA